MEAKINKTNTVTAGIAGAVIGAGVGIAATKVLSDQKKREKIKSTLSVLKQRAINSLNQAEIDSEKMKDQTHKTLNETKDVLQKKLADDKTN